MITNNIEAPRLPDTEMGGLDIGWKVLPWWKPRHEAFPDGPDTGADRPLPNSVEVSQALAAARRQLSQRQQRLLAMVSADTAEATREVAEALAPSMTEYTAAGLLAKALMQRGHDPVVLMFGGHERLVAHRHPLPTSSRLRFRAMLVCCARRHGLISSFTHIVALRSPSAEEHDRYLALVHVEAAFLDAT